MHHKLLNVQIGKLEFKQRSPLQTP